MINFWSLRVLKLSIFVFVLLSNLNGSKCEKENETNELSDSRDYLINDQEEAIKPETNPFVRTNDATPNSSEDREKFLNFDNTVSKYEGYTDRKFEKRLETIDGVELASSYKEYMELALNDLDDRLSKSGTRINDLRQRIEKRSRLLNEINMEAKRRRTTGKELEEKEKFVRSILVKNTEIKSAIASLANIAGVKLANQNEKNQLTTNSLNIIDVLEQDPILPNEKIENVTSLNIEEKKNWETLKRKQLNNSYVQIAFDELNEALANDKQILIGLVKTRVDNEYKINELEKLKERIEVSLRKLDEFEKSLSETISHDNDVKEILKQLKTRSKLEPDDKKKLLKLIGFYQQNKTFHF